MAFPRVQPQPFVPPVAIQRLPIDLQRTSLLTHDPEAVARAAVRYRTYMEGAPMPAVLPKTVLHQAWKRQPGLVTTAPYNDPLRIASSAMAALAFVGAKPPMVPSAPAFVRSAPTVAQDLGANAIPRMPGKVAAATITQIRPLNQPLHPEAALFRENVAQGVAKRLGRERRTAAMESVAIARARALAPLFARRW